MVSQIDQFCKKYTISKGNIFAIQLIIEEIITTLLNQHYVENRPNIDLTIEYSESDSKLKIYISYYGNNTNIVDNMDEIQKKILLAKTHQLEHTYSDGKNELILII